MQRWACGTVTVPLHSLQAARLLSGVTFDANSADVEDVLSRNLVKEGQRQDADPSRLLTTRREGLHLYRDVLRASRVFVWKDERGLAWRDVIRGSARQEFEAAKDETDPEIITRLLVSGRDSLQQALQKFMARREQIIQEETQPPGPASG